MAIVPGKQPLASPSLADFTSALDSMSAPPVPQITTPAGAPQIPDFSKELLPIDYGLATDPEFSVATIPSASTMFRFWQVESLLNQASDLLDRGLRDRAEYEDLQTKWIKLRLETIEFDNLNAIHNDEIAAGWYTINSELSAPEATGEQRAAAEYQTGLTILNTLMGVLLTNARIKQIATDAGQIAAITQPTAQPLTEGQSQHALGVVQSTNDAQRHAVAAETAAASGRSQSRQAKATYDASDVDFRRRRSESAILMNKLKGKAMSDTGGPYNYLDQMRPIQKRFLRDFRDAYARLAAAKTGLEDIYGFDTTSFPDINAGTPNSATSFDDCVTWTRDAIRFLVAFGQLDQNYVLPISIKTMIGGNAAFQNVLRNPTLAITDPITFTFEIPDTMFQSQWFVRLRGLSAFVVETIAGSAWQVSISPPRESVSRFFSGATGIAVRALNQTNVPSVRLGRAQTRDSIRDPDIAGIAALHNVSPISNPALPNRAWTVVVDRFSLNGTDATTLEDVQLDLLIAMHS